MKKLLLVGLWLSLVTVVLAEVVAEYDAGKARTTSGGGLVVPDSKGSFDLLVQDAAGITIGERPEDGQDTKSLLFSGSQVGVLRTENGFPSPTGRCGVELIAKLGAGDPEREATLLRYGTTWELRYTPKVGALSFIIWHSPEVYSTVSVPADEDKWLNVKAGFDGNQLTLEVSGERSSTAAKDAMRSEPSSTNLVVGSSAPKPIDGEVQRPFFGALAEIKVSIE